MNTTIQELLDSINKLLESGEVTLQTAVVIEQMLGAHKVEVKKAENELYKDEDVVWVCAVYE